MPQSKLALAVCSIAFIAFSCSKDLQRTDTTMAGAANAGGKGAHTVTTKFFSATADVDKCLGFDVQFFGNVEFITNNVNGHFTRNWSVKGLEAKSVGVTPEQKFAVVAGHEMFSVKDPTTFSGVGNPTNPLSTTVFIHQGTVVLQNTDTGEKIVIRHEIVKTPNSTSTADMPRFGWYIKGQHCGN